MRPSLPSGMGRSITIRPAWARWSTGCPSCFGPQIVGAKSDCQSRLLPDFGDCPCGITPLLTGQVVEPEGIIVDAKSGVSGAGRTPKLTIHFPECNESISAYNVGRHRHTPRSTRCSATFASGKKIEVIFTPHLVPMDRGILSTTYSLPAAGVTEEKVLGTLREFLCRRALRAGDRPSSGHEGHGQQQLLRHHRALVRGRVITISCLDNLIRERRARPCRISI